jgi:hypothetical protein
VVSLLKFPCGGFRIEATATWPLRTCNGRAFIMVMSVICNGHSSKKKIVRSGVTVMQRPWPLVKANDFS